MRILITKNEEVISMKNKIISMLSNGYSLEEISVSLLNQNNTIVLNRLIKKYGINPGDYNSKYKYTDKEWLQKQFDLYKTPHKVSQMTSIPRTCITRYALKYGIYTSKFERKPKNDIIENYFEIIDSAEKAYWIGFIMADGNIYHYKNSDKVQFEIKLKSTDIEILKKFARCIGFDETKIREGSGMRKGHECHYATIRTYNKNFCSHLAKYGITPRKSGNEIMPEHIPENFIKDFIRGFIDGDGYLSFNSTSKCIKISSTSSKIIESIEHYLISKNITMNKQVYDSDSYTMYNLVTHSKKCCKQVADYLYYDNCLALERKKQVANKLRNIVL